MIRRLTTSGVSRVMLVVVLWLLTSHAQACSCVEVTPQRALKNTQVVLTGEVVSVSRRLISVPDYESVKEGSYKKIPIDHIVRVKAHKYWRGKRKEYMQIVQPGTTCDIQFDVGGVYLFYIDSKERPWGDMCSGTKALTWAQADLAFLGPGLPPVPIPTPFLARIKWVIGGLCILVLGIVWRRRAARTCRAVTTKPLS